MTSIAAAAVVAVVIFGGRRAGVRDLKFVGLALDLTRQLYTTPPPQKKITINRSTRTTCCRGPTKGATGRPAAAVAAERTSTTTISWPTCFRYVRRFLVGTVVFPVRSVQPFPIQLNLRLSVAGHGAVSGPVDGAPAPHGANQRATLDSLPGRHGKRCLLPDGGYGSP